MIYNKKKAFTLAEVLVLLLTLSILLAAIAPVFTRRYSNVTSDDVWTYVAGDDNYNAYFDAVNKLFTNQAFIGLSPVDADDVIKMSRNESGDTLYSKVVIAASKKLGFGVNKPQSQFQFRYGDSAAGIVAGNLYACDGNMLLGGKYGGIKATDDTSNAACNTSFGFETMTNLTGGKNNTAVGYAAMKESSQGDYNTAIGYMAGFWLNAEGNTIIGNNSKGQDNQSGRLYSTVIGNDSGLNTSTGGVTIIGHNSLAKGAQRYNTAVGNNTLTKATGESNTALGHNALTNQKAGNNNTAIGADSCAFVGKNNSNNFSNITCIGAGSAPDFTMPKAEDKVNRVFIGTPPADYAVNNKSKPMAVLEVHGALDAIDTSKSGLLPYPVGDESVIINGNLVVRGQTYMEAPIYRAVQGNHNNRSNPKGLMLFKLFKNSSDMYVFGAYDGIDRDARSYEGCNGCRQHKFDDVRTNCICTSVSDSFAGHTNYKLPSKITDSTKTVRGISTSYDWFSKTNHPNNTATCNGSAAYYTDQSTGNKVNLVWTPGGVSGENFGSRETDNPLAHQEAHSCCPNLTSDIRLKNVGDKFTAGLDEIKKLNIYNFTYKNDEDKIQQVGVMAQDLKRIFPKAVAKGSDGYYSIRWDEMLYAAVNAIKTLNAKIDNLAKKIASDQDRIATLKKDNAEMSAQLDKLVEELEVLEAKKTK